MDDLVNSTERFNGSLQQPVLLIIEPLTLTRTCILSILRRELAGFEIIEMATTDGLGCVSGRDVRLAALSIGDKPIVDPSVESDLAILVDYCPNASLALLSNRDDEATALADALEKVNSGEAERMRKVASGPASAPASSPPGAPGTREKA